LTACLSDSSVTQRWGQLGRGLRSLMVYLARIYFRVRSNDVHLWWYECHCPQLATVRLHASQLPSKMQTIATSVSSGQTLFRKGLYHHCLNQLRPRRVLRCGVIPAHQCMICLSLYANQTKGDGMYLFLASHLGLCLSLTFCCNLQS
jgi:hypothetical protein